MENKIRARQYPWFLIIAFVGGIVTDVFGVFGFFLPKPKNWGDVLVLIFLGGLILTIFHGPSLEIIIKGRRKQWKWLLLRWFWLPMATCSMLGMVLSQAIVANFQWPHLVFFGMIEGVSLFLIIGLARLVTPNKARDTLQLSI